MTESVGSDVERRVLALFPTRKDAAVASTLLASAAISLTVCRHLDDLVAELNRGAAAIMLPEEALSSAAGRSLRSALAAQPPWSDLPVLVLTRPGADSAASGDAVRTLGNVTLLERPIRVTTLLSAVRTALRARERQHQIHGHLRERARAEESLRRADERKDEFLATLGHELRNPLAPLLTSLQLLDALGVEDARVTRITEVMERQLKHLVRLVDDLLEVSRITRGLIVLHRDPIDVVAVVRAAVDTCRPLLDAARHTLVIDLPQEPLVVHGDAIRLNQIFTNLLTNAAKYTNPGGRVTIRVRHDDARAVISVQDNGIGIPASHLASVFDMFMQVDRSNRRAQGGLGIGLTLVRSLVEMHDGRVEARSAGEGTGSEFLVELPASQESLRPIERARPLEPCPPFRMLIVDDNRDAGETLGALLESLGATVAVVDSGDQALERFDLFRPDVVLSDLAMPAMNGYELARRIRAKSKDASPVLLIALTGWGQADDERRSHAAGFDHHLVKPLDMYRLREILVHRWNDTHGGVRSPFVQRSSAG